MDNEDFLKLIESLLSSDKAIAQKAAAVIIEHIPNPYFYAHIFAVLNTAPRKEIQEVSINLLIKFVKNTFIPSAQDLKQFSELLMVLIQKTEENSVFRLLAALTFETAVKLQHLWTDFPSYLSIYKTNPKTIVYCIYLLKLCYQNQEFLIKYSSNINKLNKELLLLGLQNPDQEIKIISLNLIIQIVRINKEESIITQYKEHYDLIIKIAESSYNIEFKYFQSFWFHIIRLPQKDLTKFAEIAFNIFETKELSDDCKRLLIEIIVQDSHLINHENLETFTNCYFENLKLSKLENSLDYIEKFFSNLSKINFNESYELFKSNILIFLRSDLDDIQLKGLIMLDYFVDTFILYINRDISTFIDLLLKISEKSSDNFNNATKIIENYLSYNELNYEDTAKVLNFVIECFIDQADPSKITNGYFLCQAIGPTPIYFDKFIEIYQNVAELYLPEYFGILVNLHSRENDLTNDKYQQFFQFVTDFFYKSSEKVDEIKDEDEEDESKTEYNIKCLIARSSCSNLTYLFSIYNPLHFSEFFEKSIDNYIDFISREVEDISDYSVKEISFDFAQIFNINKERSIELLRNSYDDINYSRWPEYLQNILIQMEGDQFLQNTDLISYFYDIKNEPFNITSFTNNVRTIVLPMSKWIYVSGNVQLHHDFCNFVFFLFKISKNSYYSLLCGTQMIKRYCRPKAFRYNEQNQWYLHNFEKFNKLLQGFVEKILPSITQPFYCNLILPMINIMKTFIYSKNEYGFVFLQKFLLPFYEKNSESSANHLLDLFSKMIDLNYYKDDELTIMLKIINEIKDKNDFYLDLMPHLFKLITKISRIKKEITSNYFQFATDKFNDVKDEPSLLNTKVQLSFFLLSSFNQDKNKFQPVLPLIPDIVSVFPCYKLINQFFIEMKTFVDNNMDLMTKEILGAIISALLRYLYYQSNAQSIFEFDPDLDEQLKEMFSQLLDLYCKNFKVEDTEELINSLVPDHSSSIQCILSLEIFNH